MTCVDVNVYLSPVLTHTSLVTNLPQLARKFKLSKLPIAHIFSSVENFAMYKWPPTAHHKYTWIYMFDTRHLLDVHTKYLPEQSN